MSQDLRAIWDEVEAERAAELTGSPAAVVAAEEPQQTEEVVIETTTADPAPAEAVVVGSEPPKSGPPESALPADVLAKLARIEALEAQVHQQNRDFGAAIGRVAAMQREFEAAKKAAPSPGAGPTQAEIAEASKSPEKWEAMKSDFPDWSEAIELKVEQMVSSRLSGLKPTDSNPVDAPNIDEIVEQRLQRERQELAREREELRVEIRHPEWKTTIQTPEFAAWLNAQEMVVKDLAASPQASDAIKLLNEYAKSAAKPVTEVKQERSTRLAAAATTKPSHTAPPKSEAEMTPKELWDYLAKQRQTKN